MRKTRSASVEYNFPLIRYTIRPRSIMSVSLARISLLLRVSISSLLVLSALSSSQWSGDERSTARRIDIYTSRNRPTTEQLPSRGRTSSSATSCRRIRPGKNFVLVPTHDPLLRGAYRYFLWGKVDNAGNNWRPIETETSARPRPNHAPINSFFPWLMSIVIDGPNELPC